MTTIRLLWIGMLLIGTAVSVAPAATTQTIDDFNDRVDANWPLNRAALGTSTVTETGLSGVLGHSRETSLTVQTVGGGTDITIDVTGGNISYAADSGFKGMATLTYDANGLGLNSDISGAISVDILFLFTQFGMDVTLTASDGVNSGMVTETTAGGVNETITFTFADLLLDEPLLDFTNIESLSFTFDPPVNNDFIASILKVVGFISIVPEPASLTMWALMGPALLSFTRKRRRLQRAQSGR